MFTTIKNPESVRTNVRNKFMEYTLSEKTSMNMEISLFNYSIETATKKKTPKLWDNPYFVLIYSDKLKSILANLNPRIISQIQDEILDPTRIAYYTHQELDPMKWKHVLEEKEKMDKQKFERKVQASTDVFTCGNCNERNCTYSQAQIRSSDEAITTFVTCLVCDHQWTC